jgi:hypothetical protein
MFPVVVLNVQTLLSGHFGNLFQYGYLQAVTVSVEVNCRLYEEVLNILGAFAKLQKVTLSKVAE